jgi:aminopeptidase
VLNNSHALSTRLLEMAPKLVTDALRIKEGQIVEVTLTGERDYLDILDAFTLTISRVGAFPVIRLNSPSYRRRFLQTVPEKYLMKPPPHMVKWISDIDRHINLVADSPLFNPDHIAEKRRQAHMDARKKITGQIRQKNVSNIYLPTRELANYCGISFEVFEQQIVNGLDIDYNSVRRNCKRIADKIRGKNKEITLYSGDQFALTCQLADRHVFIEDGRHELPCGMVFFPPLETTVTGSVLIDECSINSNRVKQLLLEFSDGQLIRSDAESNHRCFIDLLKNSYGDSDVFAGMGVGLNPGLYSMGGNRITDFYVNGSVHISLGANLLYGGTNSSDLFIRLPVYQPDLLINGKSLVSGTQH